MFGRPIWAIFGVHLGGTRPPIFVFGALGIRPVFFCSQVVSRSDFEASLELLLAVLGTILDFYDRALEHVLWPRELVVVMCDV